MITLRNFTYHARVVRISNILTIPNCQNIVYTHLYRNQVVIDKTIRLGTLGLFFPVGCFISDAFLAANNLYSNNFLNEDRKVKGYFPSTGKVLKIRFKGKISEGFFIPVTSLYTLVDMVEVAKLKPEDTFNEICGFNLCWGSINTIAPDFEEFMKNEKHAKHMVYSGHPL